MINDKKWCQASLFMCEKIQKVFLKKEKIVDKICKMRYNIIIKSKKKGELLWQQTQEQLGEYFPSQEQVEKWIEKAHNDPKATYKEVLAYGENAIAKVAKNKGE